MAIRGAEGLEVIRLLGGDSMPVIDTYSRPTAAKGDAGLGELAESMTRLGISFNDLAANQTRAKDEADNRNLEYYVAKAGEEIEEGVPTQVQMGNILPEQSNVIRGRVAERLGFEQGRDYVNQEYERIMSDQNLIMNPQALEATLNRLKSEAYQKVKSDPAHGAGYMRAVDGVVEQIKNNATQLRTKQYNDVQLRQWGDEVVEAFDGEGDPGRPVRPNDNPASGPSSAISSSNKRIPASIRSNNPGAMWPGSSSRKFGSTKHEALNDGLGQGNKIAYFDTPEQGAAAQFDLLDRKYTGMTVGAAIRKWSGGNSSEAYAASVTKAMGISPDTPLSKDILNDPGKAITFAKAMAKIEAGRDYPMSDDQWMAGYQMYKGEAQAPVVQADGSIVPVPGADPIAPAPGGQRVAGNVVADLNGGSAPAQSSEAPSKPTPQRSEDDKVPPAIEAARNRLRHRDVAWERSGGLAQDARRQQTIDTAIREAGQRLDMSYFDKIPPEWITPEAEGRWIEAKRKVGHAIDVSVSSARAARKEARDEYIRSQKVDIDRTHASGRTVNPINYTNDPDLYEYALKRQREEAFVDPSFSLTNANRAQTLIENAAVTGKWDDMHGVDIGLSGSPSREQLDDWIDGLPDIKASDRIKLKEKVPMLMEQGTFVGGDEAKEWYNRYLGESVRMAQSNNIGQGSLLAKDYNSTARKAYDGYLRSAFKAYVEDHGKVPSGQAKLDIYDKAIDRAKAAMGELKDQKRQDSTMTNPMPAPSNRPHAPTPPQTRVEDKPLPAAPSTPAPQAAPTSKPAVPPSGKPILKRMPDGSTVPVMQGPSSAVERPRSTADSLRNGGATNER